MRPKVYTHISKSYPAGAHGTEVRIFEPDDELPDEADTLGTVRIKDTGLTVDCSYENVLAIAKSQTVQIGGNGLHITEHLRPSAGSTCHRIAGTMLRLPVEPRTDTIAPPESSGPANPAQTNPAPADPASEKPENRHTIYANAGYGFIVSEVLLVEGSSGDPTRGFDFNFGYDFAIDRIWHIGAIYARYASSMHLPLEGYGLVEDLLSLQYIGLGISAGGALGRHWSLRGTLGYGYARYREKALGIKMGAGGFGSHIMLDAEYRFNPHIGLGVNLDGFSARFHSDLLSGEEDKAAGIGRYTLSAGIRFHF